VIANKTPKSRTWLTLAAGTSLTCLLITATAHAGDLPQFKTHTITDSIQFGYQLVTADLNADGKKDLIAIDERATELAWFENPSWDRHVLATDVPRPLNAACHDIDGDGIPEVVLAYRFESRPEESEGNVVLLKSGPDVRQPWIPRDIDRVPTAHRVRWIDPEGDGNKVLLLGPMVGRRYPPQEGDRVPIYLYHPGDWKRETITQEPGGVLHAIYPVHWDDTPGQQLLTASFLGLHRFQLTDGVWNVTRLSPGDPRPWPKCGSSEVRLGHLNKLRFLATIEPWHGNQVAVYTPDGEQWTRTVIEDQMQNGHALAVGDLDGDGQDEIVCGFRGKGHHLSIYQATDSQAKHWRKTILDNGMAGADCLIEDLTADGRPDIVCIGASTGNVKLYENLAP
jgi:FG-GAP-like repeat/Aldos-2-ulose dehydratase, beta-propeller domain/FG-GAP repeat